jgi:ribonuclease J
MQVPVEAVHKMPPRDVVIMATGAQGEPMAVLNRLATGKHPSLRIQEKDTVVLSSHTIPGNEEVINEVINRLFQRGADVYYHPIAQLHVSGHASQEEQKLLINILRPRYFVPIHGELRHLKQHGKLAMEVGIPPSQVAVVENGYPLIFADGRMTVGQREPGGYVFVDGSQVGEIGPAVLAEREALGQSGFVTAVVRYSRRSGELLEEPQIATRGFVPEGERSSLIERAVDVARAAAWVKPGVSPEQVREAVLQSVSRFLYQETHRKPVVSVIVLEG